MSDFPFQRSYSLFTQHHLTFTLSVLSLSVGADSRGEDKKLWTEPNVTLVVTNLHFMWTCRLVKAVDVNVVFVGLERKHFSFIQSESGVLWFFLSFFSPHGFSESRSPSCRHRGGFTSVGVWRSRKVTAAIPHCSSVCGSSARTYFHSVGLFSHNNGAVPPSQPRKCQNVFSTCEWVSTGGKCAKGRVKSCRESESDGADGSEETRQ